MSHRMMVVEVVIKGASPEGHPHRIEGSANPTLPENFETGGE